jgi:membrane protease YdiL (CAAX protease family)
MSLNSEEMFKLINLNQINPKITRLHSKTKIGEEMTNSTATESNSQYSLAKILGIWAIVALPMPVVIFVIAPALVSRVNIHPSIVIWLLVIGGYVWQFIVSLYLIYGDIGTLRLSAVGERIWLTMPRDPNTNKSKTKLFWWLVPAALFVLLFEVGIGDFINSAFATLFPSLLTLPTSIDIEQLIVPEFIGAWWLLGIAVVNCIFNYFLGEELLFRGVLLPKMQGVFGKWDWVANAVLFGLLHLDSPLRIPRVMISTLAYTWPSRRFRSIWFAIILHGIESFIVIGVVLSIVTGMVF